MKYIYRFTCLLAALFCLGMSSSVLAASYTWTLEGTWSYASHDSIFKESSPFTGALEYEKEPSSQNFSITSFSITSDGETVSYSDFDTFSIEVTLAVPLTLQVSIYGNGTFGDSDQYPVTQMHIMYDLYNDVTQLSVRFRDYSEVSSNSFTGGSVLDYPTPPPPVFTCYGFEPPLGNGLITVREPVPVKKPKKDDAEANTVVPVKFKLRDETTGIWITGDTLEGIGPPRMNPKFVAGDVNAPSLDPSEFMLPSSETTLPRTGWFWWNSEEEVWQYNWGILTEEENPNWRSGILEIFPYSTEPSAYTIDDSCRARVLLK